MTKSLEPMAPEIKQVEEEPRSPILVRKALRKAQKQMDDYSKVNKGQARKGAEELAYHIQHMKQELQKSMRYHIRGINMNPPVVAAPLLD